MAEKRCGKCQTFKPGDDFRSSGLLGTAAAIGAAQPRRRQVGVPAASWRPLERRRRREPIPERTCRTCRQTFKPVRKDQNYSGPGNAVPNGPEKDGASEPVKDSAHVTSPLGQTGSRFAERT